MDFGRIHCFVVATREANIVYERYYDRLSELDKAEIRAGLQQTLDSSQMLQDGQEQVGCFRGAAVVCIPIGDLTFYLVGSGEYDEMALTEVLGIIIDSLKDVMGKPPSEALLHDKYSQLCVVVDEVINEGILESVDKDAIRKATKNKGYWE